MRTLTERSGDNGGKALGRSLPEVRTLRSVSFFVAVLALVLAAPAVAAGPESPPGAHKARIVKRGYWYRSVWYATDGTPIYVSCHVTRIGTRCWIRRIG